jgi:hypothetical protein
MLPGAATPSSNACHGSVREPENPSFRFRSSRSRAIQPCDVTTNRRRPGSRRPCDAGRPVAISAQRPNSRPRGRRMPDRKRTHEIRDPIHTFIKVDNRERAVLASRPLQRMRHIHQLALTYMVYPGATHKRFEHSLGAMELAGRVFDVITHPENVKFDSIASILPDRGDLPYWRRVLRAAAA